MKDQIIKLVEETLKLLGFEIVQLSISGLEEKHLEFLIDSIEGKKITISDCQKASHQISAILDVENLLQNKYFLHVSSPGITRPLVKLQDFDKFKGKNIRIKLQTKQYDKIKHKGMLLGIDDQQIILQIEEEKFLFDYTNITNARIILDDDEFRKILNKK